MDCCRRRGTRVETYLGVDRLGFQLRTDGYKRCTRSMGILLSEGEPWSRDEEAANKTRSLYPKCPLFGMLAKLVRETVKTDPGEMEQRNLIRYTYVVRFDIISFLNPAGGGGCLILFAILAVERRRPGNRAGHSQVHAATTQHH